MIIKLCKQKNLDKIINLVNKSKNPKRIVNFENNIGKILLIIASYYGHIEIVKYLVKQGADINYTTKILENAFSYAVSHGHINVVKYFVKQGTDVNMYKDEHSPLWYASLNGLFKMIKYLVKHGANIKDSEYIYTVNHFDNINQFYANVILKRLKIK